MFFGIFVCVCLLVREKNIFYRERVLFLVTQHTPRAYYYYDPGFQPERRPSDGESDHVDVRFLRLLCLLLLLLARRLTSCFFFFRFETWDACEYFRALLILSLSLSLALRYATTTTTTTLTTQGRPRDVRETRVPVPERKDERSRATKSGLRDDVSSRRMHVRVDSFLVSLAFFFSLSRARGARYTLLHVYERWCAYACAVCTNARASPHFTCHAGLSRRSNLPGRMKNFPRRNLG